MYYLPGLPADFDPHGVRAALAAIEPGRTARSEARTDRPGSIAANSSLFEAGADREIFHQRRSSTADESGL